MFIWTTRINRKRIRLLLALAAVICCGVAAAASLGGRTTSAAAATVDPKGIKTEEDRTAYLQSWGWQVKEGPALVEELSLPKEFGEEYSSYLALQSGQGFDLTRYAGKRVKRYTYEVLNYPGGKTGVVAHLLICKNRVVGGEVMGDSFLHGLEMPG